jgi:transposase
MSRSIPPSQHSPFIVLEDSNDRASCSRDTKFTPMILREIQAADDSSSALMQTHSLCATSRARRASARHDEGAHGGDTLLTKTLPKVAAEMAFSVLACNLTRVMNIVGIKPLIVAIAA